MNALEVVETLIGGMDATDRAKVAKMLGRSATAGAPQQTPCQRNGHAYRITRPEGWFSPAVMTCTKCGRSRKK